MHTKALMEFKSCSDPWKYSGWQYNSAAIRAIPLFAQEKSWVLVSFHLAPRQCIFPIITLSLRLSGLPREKVPNEPCNQNNGIPTPALVRTLLSVRRAENWKTTLHRHFKLITDNEIYDGEPGKLLNRLLYGTAHSPRLSLKSFLLLTEIRFTFDIFSCITLHYKT